MSLRAGMLAFAVIGVVLLCVSLQAASPRHDVRTTGVIRRPVLPRPPAPKRSRLTYRIITVGRARKWMYGILDALRPFLKREKEKGIKYRIRIVDNPQVNAAALADGRIYVTRGLLQFIKSDDELAGVLGHELAHVEARHHPKRGLKQALWQGLAVLAAALTKADRDGFIGASLLGSLGHLSYGRKQEFEADRLGLGYAIKAGYNPQGMIDFLTRLIEMEKKRKGYRVHPWFATHPPPYERLKRIRKIAAQAGGPFAPTVLSYDPNELFCSPMEWTDRITGLNSDEYRGDLLGSGAFEPCTSAANCMDDKGPPDGWSLSGAGSARRVAGCLKLWAQGAGELVLTSPRVEIPESASETLVELLVSGDFVSSLSVDFILVDGDGSRRMVPAESSVEARKGEWYLLRGTAGETLEKAIDSLSNPLEASFMVSLTISAKKRGILWIDELRMGLPVSGGHYLGTGVLRTNLLENAGFERCMTSKALRIKGWRVVEGRASVCRGDAREGENALCLTSESRRVVLVSRSFVEPRLKEGYMLAFSVRGKQKGCRIVAGIEMLEQEADRPVWKPDASLSCGEGWTRAKIVGTKDESRSGPGRLRIECVLPGPGAEVVIDDVALVPLMKGEKGR